MCMHTLGFNFNLLFVHSQPRRFQLVITFLLGIMNAICLVYHLQVIKRVNLMSQCQNEIMQIS